MDKLDFALEVMVVGFMVVLVTLFLLYGILIIFSLIFNKRETKVKNNNVVVANPSKPETGADKSVVIAVITAAIYKYLESSESKFSAPTLKITAQPVGDSTINSWQMTGRRHLMERKIDLETTRRNKQA